MPPQVDSREVEGMGVDFFQNPPANARALFSTDLCRTAMRKLPNPLPDFDQLPMPILRSNIPLDVEKKIEALDSVFGLENTKLVTVPKSWLDLYTYFDAVDLWIEGLNFCYHVVDRMGKRNQVRFQICSFAPEKFQNISSPTRPCN